jgi:hypothetical protein
MVGTSSAAAIPLMPNAANNAAASAIRPDRDQWRGLRIMLSPVWADGKKPAAQFGDEWEGI